jgi:hypothetical protein
LISGFCADRGFISPNLIGFFTISLFITEIVMAFMSRDSKLANSYLKPGTFYGWTLCAGGIFGCVFNVVDGYERKL